MVIFDPNYDVEVLVLIFLGHNKNKLIDGKMVYVIDVNYKHNNI